VVKGYEYTRQAGGENGGSMLMVWIGYVYVVGVLAVVTLVAGQIVAGVLLMLCALGPAALALWILRRKQLARRRRFIEMQAAEAQAVEVPPAETQTPHLPESASSPPAPELKPKVTDTASGA
jgi:hypothetical protein